MLLCISTSGNARNVSYAARGAVALGLAADEERRQGLNPRKRQRLLAAGADLIVTDFLHHEDLLCYLLAGGSAQ